ncbi:hypothetical protein N7470_001871, partial [Penicillium chermesinum]
TGMGFGLETRDAAATAAYRTTVELWTLYSVEVCVTIPEDIRSNNSPWLEETQLDDYLIWVAIVFYTAQTALAYGVGNVAGGLANNGMTPAQRASLSTNDPEYHARVVGSKIQIAGWTTYVALINAIKLSMLAFYIRLMEGLGRRYQIPIYVGFGLVAASFIAGVVTIFTSCVPFHKNWQINPDPGNQCQPAIAKPVIGVTFAANLLTDPYLIFIPIPMLWKSSLRLIKKIAVTFV